MTVHAARWRQPAWRWRGPQTTPAHTADPDSDVVTDEAARWASLDKATARQFKDDERIINEFALLYHVQNQFPLHYIVFKQTASHIPHEGNSEQIFSRSGTLSDDNGKMDAERLAIWTSIGINYDTFRPDVEKILERYLFKKFSGWQQCQCACR